jgi:hypothetical protein
VEKALAGRPRRLTPLSLGSLAVSVLFLVGGALWAVSVEGLSRLLLAALGFAGYLYFSSRAFRDIFPRLLGEDDPDPERERPRGTSRPRPHKPYLTAA